MSLNVSFSKNQYIKLIKCIKSAKATLDSNCLIRSDVIDFLMNGVHIMKSRNWKGTYMSTQHILYCYTIFEVCQHQCTFNTSSRFVLSENISPDLHLIKICFWGHIFKPLLLTVLLDLKHFYWPSNTVVAMKCEDML